MKELYIYESTKNKEFKSSEGIILLPDIYMQTEYSKRTVEEFSEAFNRPVFMLDYFFISTKEANSFSEGDREKITPMMQGFKGDDFVEFLQEALNQIKKTYPQIEKFAVVGFCFGGNLSYIAGGESSVSNIISFYGSGANSKNHVGDKTPIEYLISKRSGSDLKVYSFFGVNDPTILEDDRKKIKENLTKAGISYEPHEYDAGHAYFQEGRKNYNEPASKASWEVLKSIFK